MNRNTPTVTPHNEDANQFKPEKNVPLIIQIATKILYQRLNQHQEARHIRYPLKSHTKHI